MRIAAEHRVVRASIGLVLIAGLLGCASTQTTTERTETVTEPAAAAESDRPGAAEAGVATRETTVTTTTEAKPHPGIVRSTAGAVGSVIAAPFRVIGGVLGAIF
jgi:hypothetical protein